MSARFTKIGDAWGVKVEGSQPAKGDEVRVVKRNGDAKTVTIDQHVSGELYTIMRTERIGFYPLGEDANGKKVWGIKVPKAAKKKCGDLVEITTRAGRIASKRLGPVQQTLDNGAKIHEVAKEDE